MFGPNITGWHKLTNGGWFRQSTSGGAFSLSNGNQANAPTSASQGTQVNFDASDSNDLYGRTSTVQPAALRVLPCIKI